MQAAVILGLPFIRVSNESAFRFDVPSLKLYFFGSVVWISEAYFFLLVFLLFFVGVMLFTVLYGRIWCGWACPQTVLSDFTRSLMRASQAIIGTGVCSVILSHIILAAFSALVAASLIWYFVSPYEMVRELATLSLGPWTGGSLMFFTLLIYLDLAYVRQTFCSSVCPYARLQSAFFDHKTLTIAFDTTRTDECLGCEACVKTCPSNIDIRDGLQVDCINCAACIDACGAMTGEARKKPLIGYTFGSRGETGKGPRPRVIGLSAVFALFAVLFAYQIYVRVPVDFWIINDEAQPYHQAGIGGRSMNVFSLFVENRSLEQAEYLLSIEGIKDVELIIARNPFRLPPNSSMKMRLFIFANNRNLVERTTRLRFTLRDLKAPELKIVRDAPFIYPARSDRGIEI